MEEEGGRKSDGCEETVNGEQEKTVSGLGRSDEVNEPSSDDMVHDLDRLKISISIVDCHQVGLLQLRSRMDGKLKQFSPKLSKKKKSLVLKTVMRKTSSRDHRIGSIS
jgi:hypothetical protein